MAPTLTDYLHGIRRLWWVPVLTTLVGLVLGLLAVAGAGSPAQTQGHALFTLRIDDPGDDSAGSAREAEAGVAQSRLAGYVQLASSSPEVREILAEVGINKLPTRFSPTGDFRDGQARVLIDVSGLGLVDVRVVNKDLNETEAFQLVIALTNEVTRQALATDAQQVTPSLRPDPLITQPQSVEERASRILPISLPVLLLALIGLGLVYLIVWRQGRIYSRHDIEERIGARVLGDLAGRPADAHAIVLALTKGRASSTQVLIVAVEDAAARATGGLGNALVAAAGTLGLDVTLASADKSLERRIPVSATDQSTGADDGSGPGLVLIEATDGLDANALRAAGLVDIAALAVTYGKTTYGDLDAAGRTLAGVTDAKVAVIGIHTRPAK